MPLSRRLGADFIGTLWLVLGGCGAAVLAAKFPQVGIGLVGVALAFGLTVLTMAFAIGHISGCHLNPAVSLGLVVAGRFKPSELLPYWVAQVLGALAGAGILYLIASGANGFDLGGGFAANGYAEHSPGGYSLLSCLVSEVVMTFMFLIIILGATDPRVPKGFAPIAIGLGLTLIHLDQHPGDQHFGSPSGPQHRPGAVRRRLGRLAVVAVLGGAADRCRACGTCVSLARRGNGRGRSNYDDRLSTDHYWVTVTTRSVSSTNFGSTYPMALGFAATSFLVSLLLATRPRRLPWRPVEDRILDQYACMCAADLPAIWL